MLNCVVDHILQEFNTLFLIRFRTYKIAPPPQIKTPVKIHFGIGFFIVLSSMRKTKREERTPVLVVGCVGGGRGGCVHYSCTVEGLYYT